MPALCAGKMHPFGKEEAASVEHLFEFFCECLKHGEWELAQACVPQLHKGHGDIPKKVEKILQTLVSCPGLMRCEQHKNPQRLAWIWLLMLEKWLEWDLPSCTRERSCITCMVETAIWCSLPFITSQTFLLLGKKMFSSYCRKFPSRTQSRIGDLQHEGEFFIKPESKVIQLDTFQWPLLLKAKNMWELSNCTVLLKSRFNFQLSRVLETLTGALFQ
ncbi:uncharacterized protein [Petaurus breviceps papuanus]|uniref:uncharacterized protein isoform X4 n=1 Tax=Petaurus breviceps papuanus TaxID=3040969 RepID=UPI0036D8E666